MRLVVFLFCSLFLISCHCKKGCKSKNEVSFVPNYAPGPQAIVYKTKKNYNEYLPVIFNEEKTEIVSYPHPSDVFFNGKLAFPTELSKKYLLDNRGINKDVVFLKLKYSDYSKQMQAPSIEEMKKLILEKNPLVEMCNCGNRDSIQNIEETLNKLIESKQLDKVCKKIL